MLEIIIIVMTSEITPL